MAETNDTRAAIKQAQEELREIRRDLYGNPQIKSKGVFDRLDQLEEHLEELRATYEREKVGEGFSAEVWKEINRIRADQQIAGIYLKLIMTALGAVMLALLTGGVGFAFNLIGAG